MTPSEIIAQIMAFLGLVSRPFSDGVILAAILGGLIFGLLYNRHLKLPSALIYHYFTACVVFLLSVAVVKLVTIGQVAFAGYIGVGILWGIFVFFTWVGSKIGGPVKI